MMVSAADAPLLLIFDFDNTLIDSSIDFAALRGELVNLLAGQGQLPLPRETMLRMPIRDIVEHVASRSPHLVALAWSTIEHYEAEGLRGATVVPHARLVLEALTEIGAIVALLTNNTRAGTRRSLEELDLARLISLAVTRDDVPALKPDPAGIRLIMERVGSVRSAYLVGDSWIDGLAAQNAGIPFIGFGPRRSETEARGVTPWAWVTDLREILPLLT